jgi:hypothetical protein
MINRGEKKKGFWYFNLNVLCWNTVAEKSAATTRVRYPLNALSVARGLRNSERPHLDHFFVGPAQELFVVEQTHDPLAMC